MLSHQHLLPKHIYSRHSVLRANIYSTPNSKEVSKQRHQETGDYENNLGEPIHVEETSGSQACLRSEKVGEGGQHETEESVGFVRVPLLIERRIASR
jgi:hypothetical protein